MQGDTIGMWEVHYDKNLPYIPLDVGGANIPATRDNFELYTFAPQYSEVDHAYLIMEEQRKKRLRRVGYYLFRGATPDFDGLTQLMDEHFFLHVKLFKPSDRDISKYAEFEAGKEDRPEWLE